MDNEFLILTYIKDNSDVTQRELSKNTGLSLGTINLLLKKMVREGLIKIEKMPANRIVYMLTPKGMLEKVNKTYKYLTIHYGYINSTKNRLKDAIKYLMSKESKLTIVLDDSEIGELIRTAISEMHSLNINISTKSAELDSNDQTALIVLNSDLEEAYSQLGYKVYNLLKEI